MADEQTVFIVDDDDGVRDGLALLMDTVDQRYELHESCFQFLDMYRDGMRGCLILDIRMPRMTGIELQLKLNEMGSTLPIIFITGHGDIQLAVEAMRRGALDFIRKPFREHDLLERINEALEYDRTARQRELNIEALRNKLAGLSDRETEVFYRVANGEMNKAVAIDLGISERTVEVHRAQVMKKLGARTLAHLVRFKIEAELAEQYSMGAPGNGTPGSA